VLKRLNRKKSLNKGDIMKRTVFLVVVVILLIAFTCINGMIVASAEEIFDSPTADDVIDNSETNPNDSEQVPGDPTEPVEPVTPPEEDNPPVNPDNPTDEKTEETEEERALKEKLNELLQKLKDSEAMDYFTTTILPLLVSVGGTLLAAIALIVPYVKSNARFKKLQGVYMQLKDENNKISELLKSTDVTQLKDGLSEILGADIMSAVEGAIAELKIDKKALSEVVVRVDELQAMIAKLIDGAKVAWAESDTAVSCLCENTSQTVLEKQASHVQALEAYIVSQKGDEAQKILSEIKEEAGV